jgi:hypothetical protein
MQDGIIIKKSFSHPKIVCMVFVFTNGSIVRRFSKRNYITGVDSRGMPSRRLQPFDTDGCLIIILDTNECKLSLEFDTC